jgi:heterodisulfide reductase subunit A2
MKTGVYFCNCGTNIADRIDAAAVKALLHTDDEELHFAVMDFLCAETGLESLQDDIRQHGIERVVIGACSPRDHEETFRGAMVRAGLNPYVMQMVNIREQIAWVTEDKSKAAEKSARALRAAMRRVALQGDLDQKEIAVSPDVLVVGAGPAGLKAALAAAEAGRRVTLVEKSPAIGGKPVLFEELAPAMECGPCLLEPLMAEVLHGSHAANIELMTLSEVTKVVGSYGNFTVTIKAAPRYADPGACVGCGECVAVCPESKRNDYNFGLNSRKAVDVPFAGALPNCVSIDSSLCLHLKGGDCRLCVEACPVENAIRFDDAEKVVERHVGAVILAVGAGTFDCSALPALGAGKLEGVYTSIEFERMLASNGPTGGSPSLPDGVSPGSFAIIHCVGSLDEKYCAYCSGTCCGTAFKFNQEIAHKLPDATVHHFIREIAVPGKDEFELYGKARKNPHATFVRYESIDDLCVEQSGSRLAVRCRLPDGTESAVAVDCVVLCEATVPGAEAGRVGGLFDVEKDARGFFQELHGRADATQSRIKGVFLAGACQAPMNITQSMTQGMAAAGFALAGLVPGRMLKINPATAEVTTERCSGCRTCIGVCPYHAIRFDAGVDASVVTPSLCQGCGTCVAACPSGAIVGKHFTGEQILAELEELLR